MFLVFCRNENNCAKFEKLLKTSYDYTKSQELETFTANALPELITEHFDTEQIWQQIELQNNSFLTHSLIEVSKFVVGSSKLVFDEVQTSNLNENHEPDEDKLQKLHQSDDESSDDDDDNEPLNLDEDSDEGGLDSDDLEDDNEQADGNENENPRKKQKSSIVDDRFFKLNEMEAFLQAEEKKMMDAEPDSGNDSEENDEDVEEESDEDDDLFMGNNLEKTDTERGGVNNPKYKDFFAEQDDDEAGTGTSRNRNKFLEEIEDEEDEGEEEQEMAVKSSLEQREERLKVKMDALEDAAVGEKQWQLKGEITAEDRPQNSLLEEVVEFDLSTRPAPVMTEQTSLLLEDIIRQRIKDKAFDSVERKEKPAETPLEFKKKLVLDQEKSKESLAQIYEKEYLEMNEKLDADLGDKEEEEPQLHKDVKKMMHALMMKLDALSNFHFTPKPAQVELKVVSNLPAISMEEVAPVATSDAALLAPEEVKPKVRGDIIGKSERTETDKKRERRKKKAMQREHAVLKEKKNALGINNKHSKEKAKKLLDDVTKSRNVDKMDESTGSKSVKSSSAFFAQLEDQVKTQIKGKHSVKNTKVKQHLDAKKLKL